MMFNGFLVYGDSDTSTSDVTKSSNEPVSLDSSAASAPDRAARDQLDSTMQILKNKEETMRVQAESLALAEARIADLRRRLDAAAHDQKPARTRDCSISCCVSAADDDASAYLQEEDSAGALRDKLAVVQQLYRESFYEMARQGEAMETLRRANAQLRTRERRHSARYQELAAEVGRLKCELNDVVGSTSDSGVWGAGSAGSAGDGGAGAGGAGDPDDGGAGPRAAGSAGDGGGGAGEEVAGGLRHVAGQLRRLRDLLACDCTCGLAEENKRLKLANDSLEREARELRDRLQQLEQSLRDKDALLRKCEQAGGVRDTRDFATSADTLASHVELLQGVLNEKSSRLQTAESKTHRLRERLKKMDSVVKENVAVREELSQLSLQVERIRRAGEARPHAPARRQEEPIPEPPCSHTESVLDAPCARVRAGRHEREQERCPRVRAGRQQRAGTSEPEPCSQCGSDCAYAPPVPPRRAAKKKAPCGDQDCWCDADCGCCAGGACDVELRSTCSHHRRPSRHGHRSASETLERVTATRDAVQAARTRWRRRAPSHSPRAT